MSVTDFVVTDRSDRYVGLVTAADLKEALVYREAIPLLQVHELQRTDLPTVTPRRDARRRARQFSTHDVKSLVVLDEDGGGAMLGLITRSRLMHCYRDARARIERPPANAAPSRAGDASTRRRDVQVRVRRTR